MEENISAGGWPRGDYRDVLLDAGGERLWVRDWQRNLIVDGMRKLLAALIKGDTDKSAPLGFWAVGSGETAWDAGNLPPDNARRTRSVLFAETGRKALTPGQIKFFGGDYTNRLEVTASFTTTDLPGATNKSLREFGLFAGGTAATGSGWLINHRIHPRIDMQDGFTLQRTLRLTF